MSAEKWAKMIALSAAAVAASTLAHRQAVRMGLPPAATSAIGGVVLAVLAPMIARK
jgi:hypothetical protein